MCESFKTHFCKSRDTSSAVGKLLAIVAPMVMGSVGKIFTEQKMDQKGLSSLLGEQSKMVMQSSPDVAAMDCLKEKREIFSEVMAISVLDK